MIGKGIEINNTHTYKDLGVSISSKTIGAPTLNRITESVPFMNGIYDFSNLYGEETYDERVLQYEFDLSDISKTKINYKKIKLINFFQKNQNTILKDDSIPGYFFYLEKMTNHSFKESGLEAKLSISLSAQPFKIRTYEEGNIPWDDFIFDLDTLQKTKFNVQGSKDIKLYNESAKSITPIIVSDSEMQILKNGVTYIVSKGEIKDYRLNLNIGENKLTINGNGNIEFKFRKEIL